MAHIDDRWMRRKRGPDGKFVFNDGKPVMERDPARYGKGKRWRVRYLDPDGRERSKSFEKKFQADNFEIEVEADVLRGTYVDPDAGKVTFRKQAEEVIENRTLDPGTRYQMRVRLRKHVYPVIGSKEIGRLSQRPSMIQQLVKRLEGELAPSFVQVIMAHVKLVFSVAVEDGLIGKNPVRTKTVVLPKVVKKKIVPWTVDQVLDMGEALPPRYRAVVPVGAGLGLRQGEILGLSPDDIDWLRGIVHVKRQLKVLEGKRIFALPKGKKVRDVPLPESVKVTLSEHMRTYTPLTATLPWAELDGDPTTVRLFFSNSYGDVVHRDQLSALWRKALTQTGIVVLKPGEKRGSAYNEHGMHALRHFFASVLLTEGESVKAVSEWLGHHNAAFTLATYAHLMASSEQRMRRTLDGALQRTENQDHGPDAAQGVAE